MTERSRSPLRRQAVTLAALLLLVAAACGEPDLGQDGDPTGPLTALPPCEDPPPEVEHEPVDRLVLPEDSVIVSLNEQDPLVNVAGYVGKTPIEVRRAYESRDDIDLHSSEDEVFESEMLFSREGYRSFVRATAACDRGSNLLVVVAPDTDAAGLPAPRGDGTRTDED